MQVHENLKSRAPVKALGDALMRANRVCLSCTEACTSCADACAAEANSAEFAQCIRLSLDCADICAATTWMARRQTGSNQAIVRQMFEVCADACRACAEECRRLAPRYEACRLCAIACETCEQACRAAIASVK